MVAPQFLLPGITRYGTQMGGDSDRAGVMADQPRKPKARKGTPAQFERAFSPVALEIGRLAREWNGLHEEMGKVFSYMISPRALALPLAVWHSPTSDRVQRGLLSAALGPWAVENPKETTAKRGIKWLLDEAEKLSGKRNDALHAPLKTYMDTSTFIFEVEPDYSWGHPVAKRLQDKDVRLEFHLYRIQTACLRKYAISIWRYIANMNNASSEPLPKIPTLPRAVPA
jgi:hypothetical protein